MTWLEESGLFALMIIILILCAVALLVIKVRDLAVDIIALGFTTWAQEAARPWN